MKHIRYTFIRLNNSPLLANLIEVRMKMHFVDKDTNDCRAFPMRRLHCSVSES